MMSDRFGDLCVFSRTGIMPYGKPESLFENIVSVAGFFGFSSLPEELKIKIHICNESEFKYIKEKSYMNQPDYVVAFTCNVNQIYVLDYRNVSSWYSLNAYNAVIVHECIHAFQTYYSMISPRQYEWLYESVACYLAKQKTSYDGKNGVTWEVFTSDFYRINDCYGLAYNFGREIFKRFGDEILKVIKIPGAYTDQLAEVYNSKILK